MSNFKKGTDKIKEHAASDAHILAMQRWMDHKHTKGTGHTIATHLDHTHERLVNENKHYIGCVVKTVLICAKQGIALRSHKETADLEDPGLNRVNFFTFLVLVSEDDPIVHVRLTDGPNKPSTFITPFKMISCAPRQHWLRRTSTGGVQTPTASCFIILYNMYPSINGHPLSEKSLLGHPLPVKHGAGHDIVRDINEAGVFSLQADETKDLQK